MKNILKGLYSGIAMFLVMYGSQLVHLIPSNIGTMTVSGIATWIIATIAHSIVTPTGSRIVMPSGASKIA